MSRRMVQGRKFVWYHIDRLDAEDVEFLRSQFQFHSLDFEDLSTDNPIPKLDVYRNYLFGVFHIPRFETVERLVTDDLEVFLGADYLVTVAKHPIDAVEKFVFRAEHNPKFRADSLGRDPGYLLYKILRYAFYHAQSIVSDLMRQVTEVEQGVYNVRERKTTFQLARIRRNVLFLRTSLDPQRGMLAHIGALEREFISQDLSPYFDDVRDVLDAMWTVTENLKQVVDGLFEVNETLLSHRTNEVVTIFTALAAALMPPTLVAGIYGMNVPWLPFVSHPLLVVLVFAGSLVLFLGIYFFLEHRR